MQQRRKIILVSIAAALGLVLAIAGTDLWNDADRDVRAIGDVFVPVGIALILTGIAIWFRRARPPVLTTGTILGVHRQRLTNWLYAPAAFGLGAALMGVSMWKDGDTDWTRIADVLVASGCGLILLTVGLWFAMRYRVVVGERSVRVLGPRSVDLGAPRKLRCGQFEVIMKAPITTPLVVGRVPIPITHAWIAVEGEDGKEVVFRGTRSVAQSALGPGWPAGRPPATEHEFYGNVVKLRDAIGEAIR